MIYTVSCRDCGRVSEVFVHRYDDKLVCPECQSENVERRIDAPAVHFKGTGFYETDYKRRKQK